MKKTTKALLSAMVALVMVIALATGTTYAWITVNTTVSVDNIQSQVKSGDLGLLISKEMENGYNIGSISFGEVAPVLSDITFGKADGSVLDFYTENGDLSTAYTKVTFYFRSDKAVGIYLDTSVDTDSKAKSSVLEGNFTTNANHVDAYAWKGITAAQYGQDVAKDAKLNARAANTARVMFVTNPTLIPKTDVLDTDGETVKTAAHNFKTENAKLTIWEPNKTLGFEGGTYNLAQDYAAHLFGNTEPGVDFKKPVYTDSTKMSGKNLTFTDDSVPATAIDKVNLLNLTNDGTGIYVGTMTVYLWMEGFDSDCLKSVLDDSFITKLTFKTGEIVA